MQIDSAPDIAFKAGVEESRRVLERSALGESQLHDALVRLAGADQSIVRPNRNAPLPLLDPLRVSLFDESADMGEHLAPPVVEFLDPRVDQPRRGFALGRCALFHIACTSFGCFSILRTGPRSELCRQTSVYPRQYLLQGRKELLPPALGALVGPLLTRKEARLLHAQVGPRARRGESPSDDTLETIGRPRVRQRFVRLDCHYLTVNSAPVCAKIETVVHDRLEVVLH